MVLQRELPDLLIVDLDLPDGSGLSVIEAVRDERDNPELPILVVSAAADPAQFSEALNRGANLCLGKPLELGLLRRQVLALLRREVVGS